MESYTAKHCSWGVSWNVDHDKVLLQLTEEEKESFPDLPQQVRVRLTPGEAIQVANRLEAIANMLIREYGVAKNEHSSTQSLWDANPDCDHNIVSDWSGVKCTKCPGWFCF